MTGRRTGTGGLADGLKEPEDVALTWRRDKLGDGIQLDAECTLSLIHI